MGLGQLVSLLSFFGFLLIQTISIRIFSSGQQEIQMRPHEIPNVVVHLIFISIGGGGWAVV